MKKIIFFGLMIIFEKLSFYRINISRISSADLKFLNWHIILLRT